MHVCMSMYMYMPTSIFCTVCCRLRLTISNKHDDDDDGFVRCIPISVIVQNFSHIGQCAAELCRFNYVGYLIPLTFLCCVCESDRPSEARCLVHTIGATACNKTRDNCVCQYRNIFGARRSALARHLLRWRGCLCVCHVDVLCPNGWVDHHATFTVVAQPF